MTFLEECERLLSLGKALSRDEPIPGFDPETICEPLFRAAEAMGASLPPSGSKAGREDLERARQAWQSANGNMEQLELRQIRLLCWDASTALDPNFVAALSWHPDFSQKRVWLEGMVAAYFDQWRYMKEPEKLEVVLRQRVRETRAKTGWLAGFANEANQIFSEKAATFFARRVLDRGVTIDAELHQWQLTGRTHLFAAIVDAAIQEWLRRNSASLNGRDETTAVERLPELFDNLLAHAADQSDGLAQAVSTIITSRAAARQPACQELVRQWARSRLGDPRDPANLAKWANIHPEAVQQFKSWLARGDLRFFFDIVIPNGKDPHGRKKFWLDYVDHAIDSWVALSEADQARLRAAIGKDFAFGRAAHSDVSAFLLRFKTARTEIIVAEFSRPGNAAYFHDGRTFEEHLGPMRAPLFRLDQARGLKHNSCLLRVLHSGDWENSVRKYLISEHGIRPK